MYVNYKYTLYASVRVVEAEKKQHDMDFIHCGFYRILKAKKKTKTITKEIKMFDTTKKFISIQKSQEIVDKLAVNLRN